jgi:hypothetical protein
VKFPQDLKNWAFLLVPQKFAEIVEQIGGIRQISRVVPLLEEFEKTQRAIDIQNNASAQSTEDLAKAQQGLGFQLGQLNRNLEHSYLM